MRPLGLPLLLCALACACASDPRDGEGGGRARLNVFISPSGEPFRAGSGQPYPLDAWFARADADHDGALTVEEFEADAGRFFKTLDANHDGVIDSFEIATYEQSVAPEILPRIARLTAKDIPPLPRPTSDAPTPQVDQPSRLPVTPNFSSRGRDAPRGAAAFSLTHEPEPVAAEDTDFDGKVSLAEAMAAARRRFASLDLDHDGRLTRLELPKTPAQRLAERAPRRAVASDHAPFRLQPS